jgi:hypothetical protein
MNHSCNTPHMCPIRHLFLITVRTSMKNSNNKPNRLNLQRTCKQLNQSMTATQKIPPQLQAHFPEGGLRGLIIKILRTHGAAWTGDTQLPSDRAAAIKAAMFVEEIVSKCKEIFTAGTIRYPKQSVKNCLGEMAKDSEVGKIGLSNGEDSNRECDRPRSKWYLVK